ncbi:MAG: aminopeptidase P family N-terminal domain-containing protein, partial [Bacteroidales bacterium]
RIMIRRGLIFGVPHTPEYINWLKETLSPGSIVGLDSRFFSVALIRHIKDSLADSGIRLDTSASLLAEVWRDRPGLPTGPVFDHPVGYAGHSREEKLSLVRSALENQNSDYLFITPLDEVAWLFNLRGNDIPFCPLFIAYALVGLNEAILFVHPGKIPVELANRMVSEGIRLADYDRCEEVLLQIPEGSTVSLAPEKTNGAVYETIASRAFIREGMNITTALKAVKNATEIARLKEVMIRDGVAWVKTLQEIDHKLAQGEELTEIGIARRIAYFRSLEEDYQGESFHPISSFGPHGAVVHYSVTDETSIQVGPVGIYLLDSGGQFTGGTTDTTRTVVLGEPTPEQQRDFTLALKGTLGVSMLRFPAGTRGYQIDVLARLALWNEGRNYGHGTGHGVGFFLNVHEGPQTIGASASGYMQVTLEPGMVTTVEPGFYVEGAYGVRTENMTLVVPDIETPYGTFYRFETLTLVPIDRRLIDMALLTSSELDWLNRYHLTVRRWLVPRLEEPVRHWLERATEPL